MSLEGPAAVLSRQRYRRSSPDYFDQLVDPVAMSVDAENARTDRHLTIDDGARQEDTATAVDTPQ
jgi:hypothetical protein